MGVAVSNWQLARAVSLQGQLGVVSGTGIDAVLVRRLQLGDRDGSVRKALEAFPIPGVVERILDRYLIEGGKASNKRFKPGPMGKLKPSRWLQDLLVVANFVEVWLAKQGHRSPVGINYLEKIQLPTLPSLYGAMLAGVDHVFMGAGIPRAIPGILDRLAEHRAVEMKIDLKSHDPSENASVGFDPVKYGRGVLPSVVRPNFIAIVSSHVLATMLARRSKSKVGGFVVEGASAGGHNAPPRVKAGLSDRGEPIYGEKDIPNLETFRELGLPFWLAGSYAHNEKLQEALDLGAEGVQVGTGFAYCEESGLEHDVKQRVLEESRKGRLRVLTNPIGSPTGFPFKQVELAGTLTDESVYRDRIRVCDLGYLRSAYADADGKKGWRCPAEPIDDYVRKGGDIEDTVGRNCLCNALMSNVGLGQTKVDESTEPLLITSGDDAAQIARFLPDGASTYKAKDVIDVLLKGVTVT